MINKAGVHYPDYRCAEHNRQYCKHKRIKKTRIKFRKLFNKNRHRFIKMLTFGLPGEKQTSNRIVDHEFKAPFIRRRNSKLQFIEEMTEVKEFEIDHKLWRAELRSKFNKLRKDKWWRKHVDGGIWFYETVLTELNEFCEETDDLNDIQMKIHPHFHVILLGPRNLAGTKKEISEHGYFHGLNKLFEKYELGKPNIEVSRSKNGKPINASLNKSLWYLTNYLKKQEHSSGINRGSFGIFNSKKVRKNS